MWKNNINYSIIIPHKNTPDLLQRCIDSIPTRSDIEMIIVDDNSDEKSVDFSNFPGNKREQAKTIFTKEEKGAGYARNVGLKAATGKWIMFADADDYFLPCFLTTIDKYIESDADIIFFATDSVFSDDLSPANRHISLNKLLKKAIKTKDLNWLRYSRSEPVAKMVKKNLIDTYNIQFSETIASNDVLFAVNSGYYAKEVLADTSKVYCITARKNSLVYSINKTILDTRINVGLQIFDFLKSKNLLKYRGNTLFWIFKYKKLSYKLFAQELNNIRKKIPLSVFIKDYICMYINKAKGLSITSLKQRKLYK